MDKSPHWSEQWDRIESFSELQGNSIFSQLIDAATIYSGSSDKSRTAIEIGCFPGQFIDYVASKGYRVSGIDTYPGVDRLAGWLRQRGRDVESFAPQSLSDFVGEYRGEGYDLVLSLGFVEHFTEFCEVLWDHVRLTKVGGRIVVGAPNFASPFQRALHQTLDPQNLANHVLEAMYPIAWANFLSAVGVEINYSGHLGGFCFWSETRFDDPRRTRLQHLMTQVSPSLASLGTRFNEEESGYGVVIGTKVQDMSQQMKHVNRVSAQVNSMARKISQRDEALARQYGSFIEYMLQSQ